MIGFTDELSNIKEDFEGMIHRRHSNTDSYSKCGLPVWDVRDLRHYIQGDAIPANKDLIDCPLCSEKKITTFEE